MNSTLDSISRNTARLKCVVIGIREKKGTGITRTTKTLNEKDKLKIEKKDDTKNYFIMKEKETW